MALWMDAFDGCSFGLFILLAGSARKGMGGNYSDWLL